MEIKEDTLKEIQDIFVATDKFKELKNKTLKLEELNNYPLVLISKGSNTRYFLDNFTAENNVILTPEMELASYSLVDEFTNMGLGIGYLTKEFITEELNNNHLFEIKTTPEIPKREIGIIYCNNKTLSKSATKFIKILKEKED